MVIKVEFGERVCHQCEKCKLHYAEEEWANKCEAWCQKFRTPNINITKNFVDPIQFGHIRKE